MSLFERIASLEREHASFAIATVVARRSPVSSHLGDRALIFADGRMEGFVGGSCARDIVRRQALAALRCRQPMLLAIRPAVADSTAAGDAWRGVVESEPESGPAHTERVVIPMSCASEGAVDVYIEPRVPLRRLVIAGFTPVADALTRLATALDYAVVRVVSADELRDLGQPLGARVLALAALRGFLDELGENERGSLVAIVASQGHYDELALDALQAYRVAFVGLLASRRRASTVFGVLAQQGVPADRLAMIRNPVGLDIGARSPGEVAISILAEIVANTPLVAPADDAAMASALPPSAVDPVCGMDVDTTDAVYRRELDGQTYFFCCAGCRAAFAAEPARYLVALET